MDHTYGERERNSGVPPSRELGLTSAPGGIVPRSGDRYRVVTPLMSAADPRVFFAAERTLLAWIRTAIGLIGLGFVVARFGIFLQVLDQRGGAVTSHHISPWIGMGFALFGALTAATSSWQHVRFCRALGEDDRPLGYRAGPALVVGFGVSIAGIVLAAVLTW